MNAKSQAPVGPYAITGVKTVFVSVTEALSGDAPDILPSTPLCDIARGFWYVDDTKIKQCELLVAVKKGVILGVWEIDTVYGWHSMTITATPTRNITRIVIEPHRKYCKVKGEVLKDLKGKKLSDIKRGFRMYGPVRYNF